jgi:hypothetical protein
MENIDAKIKKSGWLSLLVTLLDPFTWVLSAIVWVLVCSPSERTLSSLLVIRYCPVLPGFLLICIVGIVSAEEEFEESPDCSLAMRDERYRELLAQGSAILYGAATTVSWIAQGIRWYRIRNSRATTAPS